MQGEFKIAAKTNMATILIKRICHLRLNNYSCDVIL